MSCLITVRTVENDGWRPLVSKYGRRVVIIKIFIPYIRFGVFSSSICSCLKHGKLAVHAHLLTSLHHGARIPAPASMLTTTVIIGIMPLADRGAAAAFFSLSPDSFGLSRSEAL